MALTTILATKELSQAYQPLLLADITFTDGTVLRASTHDIRSSTTGVQYSGHDYLPLILNQDLAAKQALSDQGIDGVPNVTLTLADADRTLWTNFEVTKGFKGATLALTFVFMDLTTNQFSSDSMVAFTGICDPPSWDETTMTLKAVSKLNMGRVNLPTVRIQKRHPFPFPSTLEERTAALNDPSSPFYATGYSADISGGFGNLRPDGQPYTADDFDGTYECYLKVLGSGSGTTATATATIGTVDFPNQIVSITVTNGGSGYTSAPFVVIQGNGTGATAHANVTDGAITSIDVDTHGQNYTQATVILDAPAGASGDLLHDSQGRSTGTFGGIRWVPPNTFTGKGYIEGKTVSGTNATNQSLYSDYVPMIYGTAMVQPPVVSVLGDPNSTRGEAILCLGKITGIINSQIAVNDVNVTAGTDLGGNPYHVSDPLIRYDVVNNGDRHGKVNRDAIFDGKGDCYGNYATIEYVVYKQIASSTGIPNIRAIVQGPQIPVFNSASPTDYTWQYTDNPVWVILDLLVKSGWSYNDVDLQSFINAASICARQIQYTKTDGSQGTHPLFQTSLVIRQRKSAAEYIRGVRTSCRATLVPNSDVSGKLQLQIDQTLADQQPNPVSGSNYNTPVASIDHNGDTKNGYVAYFFSDTNGTILRNNKKSTLTFTQNPITQSPNQVAFTFQDSENGYQQDSIATCDSEDITRASQIVSTSLNVEGIGTFDQAQRIAAWWLAKTNRGNPRGDTGGTLNFQWTTSFKALHLKVGQIVMLSSGHDGLSNVLIRLTKVTPSPNFETVKLEGSWHEDEWYLDRFGQSGYTSLSNPNRAHLNRPPFPWLPNEIAGTATDPLYSATNFTFNVEQSYDQDAGGSTIANLNIKGKLPINVFTNSVQPPLVRPSVSTSSTGGNLKGNHIYSLVVCAKDAGGSFTGPSAVINVPIAAGTNTNQITLQDITWASNTAGYALFAGYDPNTMCFQSEGSGTPGTITLSSFQDRTWGVPDIEFDRIRAKVKIVQHAGPIGTNVVSVTNNSITVAGSWADNEWAGRILSIIGDKNDYNNLPVWNFTITGNTDNVLHVNGDPLAAGVDAEDTAIIRFMADTFSPNTIGDSKMKNETYPGGMNINGEVGRIVRIIAGTGAGQTATVASNDNTTLTINGTFDPAPDATSVFIVEDPTWIEDYTSDSLSNSKRDTDFNLALRIDNFLDKVLLVQLFTVDANGTESFANKSVWREAYVYGALNASVTTTPIVDLQTAINSLPQATY